MTRDRFDSQYPVGAELQRDVGSANWIRSRLFPWGGDVGARVCSVVPAGYSKYVRVFHQIDESVGGESGGTTWAEIAELTGRVMHPTVQFTRFDWPARPLQGELNPAEATALVDVLRNWTSTAGDTWFAIWHGYGGLAGGAALLVATRRRRPRWLTRFVRQRARLEPPPDLADAPTLSLPHREYYLYRGSLDLVRRFEFKPGWLQTPNLWWPQDKAWFVGTEIDFDSTLVACSAECAKALIDSGLEAFEVSPDDRLDILGDTINPRET